MSSSAFEYGLDKTEANFVPLSPLSFLRRSADVHPAHSALMDNDLCIGWAAFHGRSCRLASALHKAGLEKGETVAVIAANAPAVLEAHFGVPMAGGVLLVIDPGTDADALSALLIQSQAKAVIADIDFVTAFDAMLPGLSAGGFVIGFGGCPAGGSDSGIGYEAFLATGDPEWVWGLPEDERSPIALHYVCNDAGNFDLVRLTHRDAYLYSLGNVHAWDIEAHPAILLAVPMYVANGLCMPWTLAAVAGTGICLEDPEAKSIYEALSSRRITHISALPAQVEGLARLCPVDKPLTKVRPRLLSVTNTTPMLSAELETAGFDIVPVSGLVETSGAVLI